MTDEEIKDVVTSLKMRINYIQTGNVALSYNDVVNAKQFWLLKYLEPCHHEQIERMQKLINRLQKGE